MVAQGIALLIAVAIILGGSRRKVPEVYTMSASAVVLGLAMGWPPGSVFRTFAVSAASIETLDLAVSVGMIKVLGGAMQKYGLLDSMASSLQRILRSARLAVMATPALLGSLSVFGGAFLSAPLVDRLGDSLGCAPARKAAINLLFRHTVFFLFPFSTTLVLTANLAGVSVFDILAVVWPLTFVMGISSYLRLLRDARRPAPLSPPHADSFRVFFVSASPILLALVLASAFPVRLPAALAAGILLAIALVRRSDGFTIRSLGGYVDWHLMGMVVAVMVLKTFVSEMSLVRDGTAALAAAGIPLEVVASLAMLVFGFASGTMQAAVAIGLSILTASAAPAAERALAAAFTYAVAFISYLVSPLHLCMVLTNKHFDVEAPAVYREIWPVVAATTVAWVAVYMLHRIAM